jgi:hypothetical protein
MDVGARTLITLALIWRPISRAQAFRKSSGSSLRTLKPSVSSRHLDDPASAIPTPVLNAYWHRNRRFPVITGLGFDKFFPAVDEALAYPFDNGIPLRKIDAIRGLVRMNRVEEPLK